MRLQLISTLMLLLGLAATATAQSYLGIGHAWSEEPPGIELTRIVPRSPAAICGLQRGDILIAIDRDTLRAAADLGRLLEQRQPGDRVTLTLQRGNRTERLPLILGNRAEYTGVMRRGDRTSFPDSTALPLNTLPSTRVDALIVETISECGLEESYEQLRRAFQSELAEYRGHYTLDAVATVLLEPRLVGSAGEWLLTTSGSRGSNGTTEQVAGMFSCLDVAAPPVSTMPLHDLPDLLELLREVNRRIDAAFAGLTAAETAALADWCAPLLESFITAFYVHWEEDLELVENCEALITSTRYIDYGALAEAGALLAQLDDPEALAVLERNLRTRYDGQPAGGGLLLDTLVALQPGATAADSTQARVVIAGGEADVHTETIALLLELGGDDLYLNNAGGTPFTIADGDRHHYRQGRVGICIDFGGDDSYLGNGEAASGSGLAGTGLLLDLAGDDVYSGARLAQGSAFAGCGLLHDYAGDDLYLGQEAVQAAAWFGCGLLRDDAGDDSYNAALYAQGCGGAKGCGQLLDLAGADRYLATHKHPNGYGNEATWSGWSQGVGVGFRQLATGGVGILSDRQGDDEYIAGNFSQGCGYFFGFGLLSDGGGNDRVTGNRYCQAALAHQAAACFFDAGGDDHYFGQEATNQGGTWDVGAALFLDCAGNDSYQGGSLSQGGCAQNAMAVFCDLAGRDSYSAGGSSQGAGGGNSYDEGRGALSLGLFFDLGGGQDTYSDSLRGNGRRLLTDTDDDPASGEGVFVDR